MYSLDFSVLYAGIIISVFVVASILSAISIGALLIVAAKRKKKRVLL